MADPIEDTVTDDKVVDQTDDKATDQVADKGDGGKGDAPADKVIDKAADKSGTALDDDGEDKPVTAVADWPSDWRQKLAGEDKGALKTLARFPSPPAFWKAYQSMRQKVSTGELKSVLPEDATPEQKAEWRKANGYPEAPDKYEIKLDDGLVIGESDKELVGDFQKVAFENDFTPKQINGALNWYYSMAQMQEAEIAERNKAARAACEDELRAEWGGEYRGNLSTVSALLDGAPEGVKAAVLSATLPDGTALLNNPNAMRFFASVSREINPAGVIVGADGSAGTGGLEARIAEIEKVMATDRKAYNADEKMQEELRKLYGARERLSSRAA